jgi:hypothetical protein
MFSSSDSGNELLSNIVDQNDGRGVPIKTFDNGKEILLTSSIPKLQFHPIVLIDVQFFGGKFHT